MARGTSTSSRRRLLVSVAATLAILAGLGWLWAASLLPASYAATDMGIMDAGEGTAADSGRVDHPGHAGHGAATGGRTAHDVASLVERRSGRADVSVTLTARLERITLEDGLSLHGLHPERCNAWAHHPGSAGRSGGGQTGERLRARRNDLALARA